MTTKCLSKLVPKHLYELKLIRIGLIEMERYFKMGQFRVECWCKGIVSERQEIKISYTSKGSHMNKLTLQKQIQKNLSFSTLFTIFVLMMLVLMNTIPPFVQAQDYSRGIGIYPGDKKEDYSPVMQPDTTHYRNLALHRPAYHSSSYDYNLTAQLITDGIKETQLPGWLVVTCSDGLVSKDERQYILDRHPMTGKGFEGTKGWIQIELKGNSIIPSIDSINLLGSMIVDSSDAKHWDITMSGSENGTQWVTLSTLSGDSLPGETTTGFRRRFSPPNLRILNYPFNLSTTVRYHYYRLGFDSPNALRWNIADLEMYSRGKAAMIGGPYQFTSAWMSEGKSNEWVYVDLGNECSFDRIVLYWIRKAQSGSVQISNDALHWTDISTLPQSPEPTDEIKLDKAVKGRYVRILMRKPMYPEGYILSEMEVYGRGGFVAVSHVQPEGTEDGRLDLAGGAWKVQRELLAKAYGESISKPGFNDRDWIIATVPGTVLVSYLNAGAIPEPNYGDNQLMISDSFFYSNFWYRNEFVAPISYAGKKVFLNFDGINWKADIYLNGQKLGRMEGAFTRGKFDVTGILVPGDKNALAVHLFKNDHPGFVTEQTKYTPDANGGELGADNPTFHASVGWDWIPTIRGRNTGIWNKVYLSESGPVTIENPFVSAHLPLPDTTSADIKVEVTLCNHGSKSISGTLRGKIGEVSFEQPVTIAASNTINVKLNPSTNPSLRLSHPKLWWPNGYGEQNLYTVELQFVTGDNQVSDIKTFQTGLREMTYSEESGVLKIWVNGKRFIGRGGNWGFPEELLRYRNREYDIAVRYHKDMNFTMIRNWVGQTGDDEFYDACDRYGIMVWQDFWLANPLDGPNPNDNDMFLKNVEDFVKRVRNHPSIGLYCGRNEGNPPEAIDTGIRKLLPVLHPDIHYISNSAFGVVSGGGPYRAMPVKFYFEQRATEKLHSELGMPNVISYESLRQTMPESYLWPQSRLWGVHDFCQFGAMGGSTYNQMLEDSFGPVDNLKEWLEYAQWINYQGYRAMFEAQSKNRMGLLLWMSHPAWPSLVWQTYDYYFEPTAAYFGSKKANEPLHIQWNALTNEVEVVNYSEPKGDGLTATMEIFNLDGTLKSQKTVAVTCPEDSTVSCIADFQSVLCFEVETTYGLSSVYFLRLSLKRGKEIVSENFYWRGIEENNFKAIRKLPKVKLDMNTVLKQDQNRWYLTVQLGNHTNHPALMVKLKAIGEKSKERILPVMYSDNYVSLMPHEQKTITIELQKADARGEKPAVVLEGVNIE